MTDSLLIPLPTLYLHPLHRRSLISLVITTKNDRKTRFCLYWTFVLAHGMLNVPRLHNLLAIPIGSILRSILLTSCTFHSNEDSFFFFLARRFVVRLVPAASRAMDVLTLLKRDGYGVYKKHF